MAEKLLKGIDQAFKDVDLQKRTVTGYFAHFGSKDSDGDIIEPGSFKKTIQERGPQGKQLIKFLLDHDKYKAIGKINELREDNYGLYYEATIGSHTLGTDFVKMVESEIINQHSFGYRIIKDQYDSNLKANMIKELYMYEGSAVQFLGANENTPIVGIKSLEDALQMVSKLEKFVKTSDATDETLLKLDTQLKSLQESLEPLLSTQEKAEPISELIKNLYNVNLS